MLALVLALAAPGLTIDWQAPAGCPDVTAVRGQVAAMIGEDVVAGADLRASAVVREDGDRWSLTLELTRAGGRELRSLGDRECEALAQAAALVIAVAIDPQARAPEPVPEDSPETVVPAPPEQPGGAAGAANPKAEPVPKARPEPPPPSPPIERETDPAALPLPIPRLMLGLRLGVGLGFARILPGVHAALDLGLGLDGRGWRVELNGLFVPPVRGSAAGNPEIGGVFRLGAGEVRGCYMPTARRGRLGVPVCLGAQVGAMHGQGTGSGLQEKQAARGLWAALRPGVAVRLRPRLGRVGLWMGLDMIVALARPEFITAGGVKVHRAAPVGGQVSLGVEVRLR